MDSQEIMRVVKYVTNQYEENRVKEILGSQTKVGRLNADQIQGAIGKAQACKELRSLLYNAFGFSA